MTRLHLNTFNLKEIEKVAVIAAITYTKGNMQYAMELLNISKATMYRLLREYKVDYQQIREDNDYTHTHWRTKCIK